MDIVLKEEKEVYSIKLWEYCNGMCIVHSDTLAVENFANCDKSHFDITIRTPATVATVCTLRVILKLACSTVHLLLSLNII
jgi:hypothetical protein